MFYKIITDAAPPAIGPYSQAMVLNDVLYTSGQIALDIKTGTMVGTSIEEQTEQVMKNISGILKSAGTSFEATIKTTCFLTNMDDFTVFNKIYAKYFKEGPARSCVAVKSLPKDALVEIEVIAAILK